MSMTGVELARCLRRIAAVVAVLAFVRVGAAAAPQRKDPVQGRPLSDVLTSYQRAGLRIVFSSELVTPDMRVVAEPRGTTLRQRLDEILEPHGLRTAPGPDSIILVVRARRLPPATRAPPDRAGVDNVGRSDHALPSPLGYRERVEVSAAGSERGMTGSITEISLGADSLAHATGVVPDDPLYAAHAMPRVTAADDFRSEFSVRGSSYRHVGVVIDGFATPWLRHTVHGRDVGSLSMFGLDSVERATLRVGAYPRRHGDGLVAELEFRLSEGSREATRFRGSLGGTSAAVAAEGPIGGEQRGSWRLSARQSYLGWPMRRLAQPGAGFGFADAEVKLVYDLRPTQQLTVSLLAGRSVADESDDTLPEALIGGTNRAALANVGWRLTLGARTTLEHRAVLVSHDFFSAPQSGASSQGSDQAIAYRGTVTRSLLGGVLESGAEVQREQGSRRLPDEAVEGAWTTRAGYGDFQRTFGPLTLGAGVRVADSSLVSRHVWSRWVRADWQVRPAWTLSTSAGVTHQFPELEDARRLAGLRPLEAERATHVDVGVERWFPGSVRWQATVFARDEREGLRETALQPRVVVGLAKDPDKLERIDNGLNGRSRGVEILLARQGSPRLAGWASYAYAVTRYADPIRREVFWGDFDQRHTLNVSGAFRLSDRTSVSVNYRTSTGAPIPGYFAMRDGRLFIADRPNEVRLPRYARLDLRVQRTVTSFGRQVSFFVEVLNVLDRENRAPSSGTVVPATGEAVGFTRSLVPRRPAAGLVISF